MNWCKIKHRWRRLYADTPLSPTGIIWVGRVCLRCGMRKREKWATAPGLDALYARAAIRENESQ